MSSDPSPNPVTPRTEAGRDLLDSMGEVAATWTNADFEAAIVAVEREAAVPATEALRAALERLGERHHALSDHNPATVFQMRPAFEGLAECDDYTCVDARAALGEPSP